MTMECSCRLCPSPGMYAVTSTPLDRRTRATLRSAEFGFFGVLVYTRVQTPRRWGAPLRAGVLPLVGLSWRPLRTNCWMVGTNEPLDRLRRPARATTSVAGPSCHAKGARALVANGVQDRGGAR